MHAVKYVLRGSDCIGVFASATDMYVFSGPDLTEGNRKVLSETLEVECADVSIGNSGLIGIFMRANSNGIVLSNLASEREVERIRKLVDLRVEVLDSSLNAIGNNIIANDRIAIVNSEYDSVSAKRIGDILGVEVVRKSVGDFNTVGANNILTNKGLVVSNHCTDREKEELDELTGFDSTRSTANTGSLGIGIAAIANSKGALVGEDTTGHEMVKILDGLDIR